MDLQSIDPTVGNSGQLNSEFKSIAYSVRGCQSTLQCSPIARQSKCLEPESNQGCRYFNLSDYFVFTK